MTKPAPQIRVVKSMLYLLSRTGAELPNKNPAGFVEARFVNELETAVFLRDEFGNTANKILT